MSQVYVALLGEGTVVWRPVQARSLGDGVYELLGAMDLGEEWEFKPGQFVFCEQHVFPSGQSRLVARRPIEA